jgi:hypothetical protein
MDQLNQVIFLDYHEVYAGLCNQLYLITNHIYEAYQKKTKIYINKINIDVFKNKRVPATDVFDFVKTNKNINKLIGMDLILYEKPLNFYIPELCIYPVISIEFLNCLEFNESILKHVPKIIDYNGIHFRLEIDVIVSYLFSTDTYTLFMDLCNTDMDSAIEFSIKLVKIPEVVEYIQFIMNQYFSFISELGFSKIWYICTAIGKNKIHDPLIPFLKELQQFILTNKGIPVVGNVYYQERELNALVELLILRDSKKMVGFEGSSFSEGYAFKVNTIRNPYKEYRFVDGIVKGKLSLDTMLPLSL